ncbi:hypothetical protein DPMN_037576 [Dreissena polymorpha]|uniref:Uncharacterized protein n=1 Tax=Dreissena polymorpha TaxID=45954 RepID=A0A9D4RMZ1_DREPO|nr:hypothetical protein DPMN_037576 [Dreissena polymorpha]
MSEILRIPRDLISLPCLKFRLDPSVNSIKTGLLTANYVSFEGRIQAASRLTGKTRSLLLSEKHSGQYQGALKPPAF